MGKYTQLASDIIRYVGGKDNVIDLRHCITRLRFHLKDESKADRKALESEDGVIAVARGGGEYMVVIGEHVPEVYDEVVSQLGIGEKAANSKTDSSGSKNGFFAKVVNLMSAAMGPTVNLLCASGIIKGVLVIFTVMGLSTESGIYMLANAAGDAIFYGMPVFMGFNVAKYFGIDPYFGFLLGAALTYPTLQGVDLSFGSFTVNATYTSSFLPVLFGLLLAAPIYKYLNKHLPTSIKDFLTPMLTLLIAFPITFILIGPVANTIGNGLGVVMNYLFDKAPLIAYPLLAGLWQILVMFGVHGVIMMFPFYALLAGTPSSMIAASAGTCFVMFGSMLALRQKTKDQELKSSASAAAVSAVLGVTEPAMYGIVVKDTRLLVLICLENTISGFVAGLFKLTMYSYAGMGLIGMLGFLNPDDPQLIAPIIVTLVSMAAGYLLTMMFYKEKEPDGTAGNISSGNSSDFIALPVSGTVHSVSEASDSAFATESLGKGIVIDPDSDEIDAPASGTVKTLFPTNHAIGIATDDGKEILIHIGINTINLQGKYFEAFVKQGEKVEKGQKLITFNRDEINKAGYSTEVIMVITNSDQYLDVIPAAEGKQEKGTNAIRILEKENA